MGQSVDQWFGAGVQRVTAKGPASVFQSGGTVAYLNCACGHLICLIQRRHFTVLQIHVNQTLRKPPLSQSSLLPDTGELTPSWNFAFHSSMAK